MSLRGASALLGHRLDRHGPALPGASLRLREAGLNRRSTHAFATVQPFSRFLKLAISLSDERGEALVEVRRDVVAHLAERRAADGHALRGERDVDRAQAGLVAAARHVDAGVVDAGVDQVHRAELLLRAAQLDVRRLGVVDVDEVELGVDADLGVHPRPAAEVDALRHQHRVALGDRQRHLERRCVGGVDDAGGGRAAGRLEAAAVVGGDADADLVAAALELRSSLPTAPSVTVAVIFWPPELEL